MNRIQLINFFIGLFVVFSCSGQETAVERASWTLRYADNLEKALKQPLQANGVYILNYEDSVFPNEDIAGLVNIRQIVVHGKERLRKRRKDVAASPSRIRIDTVRLQKLTKLKYLTLAYFDFEKFPLELCRLKNLELLEVSFCHLDSLPEEIAGLENLKMLVARGNKLSELPASITQLDSLQFLDLGNNRFATIPAVLATMQALRKVSLANPESNEEKAERHWKWPYPLHINVIDFVSDFTALQTLLSKPHLENVYLMTDSKKTSSEIMSRLNSTELYNKITWGYFPPPKSRKK